MGRDDYPDIPLRIEAIPETTVKSVWIHQSTFGHSCSCLQARSTKRRDEISEGDFFQTPSPRHCAPLWLWPSGQALERASSNPFTRQRLGVHALNRAAGHGVGRPGFNGSAQPPSIRGPRAQKPNRGAQGGRNTVVVVTVRGSLY